MNDVKKIIEKAKRYMNRGDEFWNINRVDAVPLIAHIEKLEERLREGTSQIRQLSDSHRHLQAIVDKWPKTADGVRGKFGMEVFWESAIYPGTFKPGWWDGGPIMAKFVGEDCVVNGVSLSACYSTKEAAEAARLSQRATLTLALADQLEAEAASSAADLSRAKPSEAAQERPTLRESLDEIYDAGGKAWDNVADPKALIEGTDSAAKEAEHE